ncbi:MAG: DUF4403 family protein [Rhizomicrobium sp.]
MRTSFRGLAVFFVLILTACGFEAPPPKRTPAPLAPPLPVSTLSASLTVPVATIVRELDEKTQTEIANIKDQPVDCMIAQCRLDLVATRTGPISGHAADGRLSLNVPLAATAQLELKSAFFKTKANALATGEASADTVISLDPDWRLRTQTQGVVRLSDARLKLGPLKMSLADIWNRNAQQLSQPLFRTLDRHLASSLKIKPQAERLWLKVQRPIRIGKSPAAWLVLAPERIRISGPTTQNNAFVVSMGIDVRARVVVGDSPPEQPIDRALPAPAPLAAPANRFSFVVPVLLPYDEAAALAMRKLSGMPLRIGGALVRFERLAILPSGEDVIIAARFCVAQSWDKFGWFDSCGEGYLRGQPVFDAQSGTIRIARVHYDIATEGAILAAMRALAGDELSKALETKLVFHIARDIAKLDDELKTALARPQGRGVIVSGEVQSFGAPQLTWTKDGFLATFPAEGTIRAELNLKDR